MATTSKKKKKIDFPYAKKAFADHGLKDEIWLPSTQNEYWKYTNLSSLSRIDFFKNPNNETNLESCEFSIDPYEGGSYDIFFFNGHIVETFLENFSDIDGLSVSLSDNQGNVSIDSNPLILMNQKLKGDSINIEVSQNTILDKPIRLIFFSSKHRNPVAWHPGVNLKINRGSKVEVFEHYLSESNDVYWCNSLLSIELGQSAELDHYRLQEESINAWNTSYNLVSIGENSQYENFSLVTGAEMSRNEINLELNGRDSICSLNGSHLVDSKRVSDTTTQIIHNAPYSKSQEKYLSILGGNSRSVLQGKIIVAREAQNIEGEQLLRSILLSENAEACTKPELEIYADQVKCTHGATIGQLDDSQLFYLQSRGLNLNDAKALIINGLMNDHFNLIRSKEARDLMRGAFESSLRGNLEILGTI
tara:strand:- start:3161 stop:4417 length:1257 start_codon:yes stop_codon:yes gene_type:complete